MHIPKGKTQNIAVALAANILLAYAILAACRLIFVATNHSLYAEAFSAETIIPLLKGALLFDTSAVCYLNIPYILLLLFPLHIKECDTTDRLTRLLYVACNGAGVVANLADTVYVPFTGRRTTWSLFSEFSNEGNMGQIIGSEIVNHWYLVVAGILLIWLLNRLYSTARHEDWNLPLYYASRIILLTLSALLIVAGIRGGIGRTVRPITLSNANQYVSSPNEAAIVLNTPFSMIRTIGKKPFKIIPYFDEKELATIFNPEQKFTAAGTKNPKNVVIFILESFGKEYIGALNPTRTTASRTPFLDSLITVSRTFARSYANGRKSIDGMPSVLSGIPMFVEPFFVTPAALNKVSGVAGTLGEKGYNSAFFHGAPNGSMGFQAFANATGFQKYYGLDEYDAAPERSAAVDFDGAWAIWDEPFFKFYAESINDIEQPFVTALFSASSHHPFNIPEQYRGVFKEGTTPLQKCVEYTDNALRKFFNMAKKEEWYKNTLFVITADHSNQNTEPRYNTSAGSFEVPIIFFSPAAEAPFAPCIDSTRIAQQIDIMPTILDYIGYDEPFVAFGNSLISHPAEDSFAVNYLNGIYQYYKGEYLLLFDEEKSIGLYNLTNDPLMQRNILDTTPVEKSMERELKAIIQQYMTRMTNDRLVPQK